MKKSHKQPCHWYCFGNTAVDPSIEGSSVGLGIFMFGSVATLSIIAYNLGITAETAAAHSREKNSEFRNHPPRIQSNSRSGTKAANHTWACVRGRKAFIMCSPFSTSDTPVNKSEHPEEEPCMYMYEMNIVLH